MQPLYTKAEFQSATSRQLLPLCCLNCTTTFYKTKHYIQCALAPSSHETANFCSKACVSSYFLPTVLCTHCHKKFIKKRQDIERSPTHFCSRSCAAKHNNTHKTTGTRVSKLEVWLSKKLPELYPSLDFHFNRKDAINAELDIYIPSLRLAFELNGIFHYEPIYGAEKLKSTQNNDTRKSQACLECGIELCIIDVSTQKYFKEQSSIKFLQIIQNIINQAISRQLSDVTI